MSSRRKGTEAPLERAWSALMLLGEPIQYDAVRGKTTGADDVEEGLDAMATALAELKKLESAGGPLDEVLAELNEEEIMHAAAELIEIVGQVGYAGGLSYEETEHAERLRERLHGALDDLLNRLKEEQSDD